MPSTIDTTLITIEARIAPTIASAVRFGGKPPIVKVMSSLSAIHATSSSRSALRTSENRPSVSSVIGSDSSLQDRLHVGVDQRQDQGHDDDLEPVALELQEVVRGGERDLRHHPHGHEDRDRVDDDLDQQVDHEPMPSSALDTPTSR